MYEGEVKKQIKPTFDILVRDYDENRCSFNCQFIKKISGTYHCTLFDKEVDEGDDDTRDDYIFVRAKECLELTNRGVE